jgi:F0F1-type ATP synthase assembly protein I
LSLGWEMQEIASLEPSNSSYLLKALGLGVQIALTLLVCVLVGLNLDRWLNTTPWLLIIGVFVGIANVFKILFDWSKS